MSGLVPGDPPIRIPTKMPPTKGFVLACIPPAVRGAASAIYNW